MTPPIVVATRVELTPQELKLASADTAEALGMAEPLLSSNKSGKVRYEPAVWAELENQRFEREKAEAKRLMYVAASRAKDAVIVSHSAADFSKNDAEARVTGAQIWQTMLEEQFLEGKFPQYTVRADLPFELTLQLDYLFDAQAPVPGWPESVAAFAQAEQRAATCGAGAGGGEAGAGGEVPETNSDADDSERGASESGGSALNTEYAAEETVPSREVEYALAEASAAESLTQVSASHIGSYNSCPRQYHLQYRVGAGSLRTRDPDDATNLGNALHAILERGWASATLDADRALAILRTHRISEPRHEDVRRQATALLESQSMTEIRNVDYTVSAERQFYVPIGDCVSHPSSNPGQGVFLQGYIDLLATRADGTARVLDYKSGQGREREAYETQARCYAVVALAAGAKSVEVRFLMPDADAPPPGAELDGEIPFHRFTYNSSDMATIEEEILEVVGRMARAASVTDEDLKEQVAFKTCHNCGYGGPLCVVGAQRKKR